MLRGNNSKLIWIDECESFTEEEMREFMERQRKIERELNRAAEAGLFLTAADLNE